MGVRLLHEQHSALTLHGNQRIRRRTSDVRKHGAKAYVCKKPPSRNVLDAQRLDTDIQNSVQRYHTHQNAYYLYMSMVVDAVKLYEPHSKHCGHWSR